MLPFVKKFEQLSVQPPSATPIVPKMSTETANGNGVPRSASFLDVRSTVEADVPPSKRAKTAAVVNLLEGRKAVQVRCFSNAIMYFMHIDGPNGVRKPQICIWVALGEGVLVPAACMSGALALSANPDGWTGAKIAHECRLLICLARAACL